MIIMLYGHIIEEKDPLQLQEYFRDNKDMAIIKTNYYLNYI